MCWSIRYKVIVVEIELDVTHYQQHLLILIEELIKQKFPIIVCLYINSLRGASFGAGHYDQIVSKSLQFAYIAIYYK